MYNGEQVLAFYEAHKKKGITLAECIDEALALAENKLLKEATLCEENVKKKGFPYMFCIDTSLLESLPIKHQRPFTFWVMENRYKRKPNKQITEASYTNWLVHTGLQ